MLLNQIKFSHYFKSVFKIIFLDFLLVVGILLILFGGYLYYQSNYRPEIKADINENVSYDYEKLSLNYSKINSDTKLVKVVIPYGVSTFTVAQILEENDLISATEFLKLVDKLSLEKEIKAGSYTIREDAGFLDIIKTIRK